VRALAGKRGSDFEPVAVSSLRSAAQAIEQFKTIPATGAIVWFHKGVLGLNPDILVPNLVRISWARDLPIVADRVDYVQRGILLAVSPDYQAFGRRAAKLSAAREPGLIYLPATCWALHVRSAALIGIELQTDDEWRFDYVHE